MYVPFKVYLRFVEAFCGYVTTTILKTRSLPLLAAVVLYYRIVVSSVWLLCMMSLIVGIHLILYFLVALFR